MQFKKQNPQKKISSGSVARRDLISALKGYIIFKLAALYA
jgi:hypothetical protein